MNSILKKLAANVKESAHPVLDKIAKELTTKGREKIKPKNFAMPKQEKYPIHDLSHARNALARVSQFGSPAEQATVRSKVYAKYPGLKERKMEKTSSLRQKILNSIKENSFKKAIA